MFCPNEETWWIELEIWLFNGPFKDIFVRSWLTDLLVEETRSTWRKPPTLCMSLTNCMSLTRFYYIRCWPSIPHHKCNKYTLPQVGHIHFTLPHMDGIHFTISGSSTLQPKWIEYTSPQVLLTSGSSTPHHRWIKYTSPQMDGVCLAIGRSSTLHPMWDSNSQTWVVIETDRTGK